MENLKIVEVIIILIVGITQFVFFIKTANQIFQLKSIFPQNSEFISVESAYISKEELNNNANELITSFYLGEKKEKLNSSDNEFNLLRPKEKKNDEIFDSIVFSINKYIIKDKSKVVDYNTMKDIVERNCDALDEEINIQLPIPIYLGLAGTMAGIIIGLFNFNIAELFTNKANSIEISVLLGGVKIAMIASLLGLVFTIINSGILYKGAKTNIEKKKNEFYTFIQTELLPSLSQSISSTIVELNQGMKKFTSEFRDNIFRLENAVNSNFAAVKIQNEVMKRIIELKPQRLTQMNVDLFQRLETNIVEFDKFNSYVQSINNTLNASLLLNNKLDSILDRTNNLESITLRFLQNVEDANKLQIFLSSHISEITDREDFINKAIARIDDSIQKSMSSLEEHIKIRSSALEKAMTVEEDHLNEIFRFQQDNLNKIFSEGDHFRKLNTLTSIDERIKSFKTNEIHAILGKTHTELTELNKKLSKGNVVKPITGINGGSIIAVGKKSFFQKIKRPFVKLFRK
ncbi:MAG: hypothetical protein ACOYO1_11240 [Bacteroidales bacterium]